MKLSVVIPVYNQMDALYFTLEGFSLQEECQHEFEIIVVDDGSTEPIYDLCEKWSSLLNLQYTKLPNSGRAAARNVGVRLAKGDLIIFNDADRIPAVHFLAGHTKNHAENRLTVGHVRELYFSNLRAKAEEIRESWKRGRLYKIPQYCKLVYQLYDQDGYTDSSIPWISTFSGNMSLDRSTLEKLGLFDEEFTQWGFEHFELGFRAYTSGMQFMYCSEAINYHLAHPRGEGFYQQAITESLKLFYEKHPKQIISKFGEFMWGDCTLPELESEYGNAQAQWLHKKLGEVRVRMQRG